MIVLGLCAALTSVVAGQTPVQDLAKPPATARHFIIQSTGGRHGESWMWDAPDGTRMGRESMNLRGQVFELDSSGKAGPDGMPAAITVRGFTPEGDAGETFSDRRGNGAMEESHRCRQCGLRDAGVLCRAGRSDGLNAWLIEALLARPDKTLALLPGGKAHAEKLDHASGRRRRDHANDHALGASPASAPRRCPSGPMRTSNFLAA